MNDTIIAAKAVDPTEIRKEYAYKMEHVTRVRDASRSSKEGRDVTVNGYHGCIAAACTMPVRLARILRIRQAREEHRPHRPEDRKGRHIPVPAGLR